MQRGKASGLSRSKCVKMCASLPLCRLTVSGYPAGPLPVLTLSDLSRPFLCLEGVQECCAVLATQQLLYLGFTASLPLFDARFRRTESLVEGA